MENAIHNPSLNRESEAINQTFGRDGYTEQVNVNDEQLFNDQGLTLQEQSNHQETLPLNDWYDLSNGAMIGFFTEGIENISLHAGGLFIAFQKVRDPEQVVAGVWRVSREMDFSINGSAYDGQVILYIPPTHPDYLAVLDHLNDQLQPEQNLDSNGDIVATDTRTHERNRLADASSVLNTTGFALNLMGNSDLFTREVLPRIEQIGVDITAVMSNRVASLSTSIPTLAPTPTATPVPPVNINPDARESLRQAMANPDAKRGSAVNNQLSALQGMRSKRANAA